MIENKIEALKCMTSGRNDMISLYIPAGMSIFEALIPLRNELKYTENIKDKITRNNVIMAITNMVQAIAMTGMKRLEEPKNGVMIFSTPDTYYIIEPENPIKIKLYFCDKKFHLV